MEEVKKEKINFFKKIWWSITKVSKYSNMIEQGMFSSIMYYLILILIFTTIFAIPISVQTVEMYDNGYLYLEENLPELTFQNGVLTTEVEEFEIQEKLVEIIVGGNIIVNSSLTSQDDIDEYTHGFGTSLGYILLKDKIMVVNLVEEITEYDYEEFVLKYFGVEIDYFTKDHILEFIEAGAEIGLLKQYSVALVAYYLSWTAAFLMYIFPVTLVMYLLAKAIKKPMRMGNIVAMNIYAYTLSIILQLIHVIQALYTNVYWVWMEIVIIITGSIYAGLYLNKVEKNKIKEK